MNGCLPRITMNMNFTTGTALLQICEENNIPISEAMLLRESNHLEKEPH